MNSKKDNEEERRRSIELATIGGGSIDDGGESVYVL